MFLPLRHIEHDPVPITVYESAEDMAIRQGDRDRVEADREVYLRSFARPRLALTTDQATRVYLEGKYD